jgi:hypothetical protein
MAVAFEEVMGDSRRLKRARAAAGRRRAFTGRTGFSTRFKIAETCAAVLGGVGVAVSDIREPKTGRAQAVTIDDYATVPNGMRRYSRQRSMRRRYLGL